MGAVNYSNQQGMVCSDSLDNMVLMGAVNYSNITLWVCVAYSQQ